MKLVKNYLYTLSYQVLVLLLPLITVPYIARTIGAAGVGVNAYTNSIVSYFVLLANLGLLVYGNRAISYSRDSEKERSKAFFEIVCLQLAMMVVSLTLFSVFVLVYQKYTLYFFIQGLQIIATGLDISWFFTGMEDFKKTVVRSTFVKLLSFVAMLVFVHQSADLWKYILILATSTLLGNLTLWTYIKHYLAKIPLRTIKLTPHIAPIFILFLPQLTTTVFVSLNRILLGNLSTISQTGYFDNADKVVRLLLTLITAVGTVTFPRIAHSFKQADHAAVNAYVKNAFDVTSLIAFPLVFGMISVAKPFSTLFFGSNFAGIEHVISLSIIGLLFMGWSSILGQQFLVAINKVRGLTVSMLISLVFTLLSGLLLIPKYGAIGAAIGATVGEAVIAIVLLHFVRQELDLKNLFRDVWKFLASSVIMLLVCLISAKWIERELVSIGVQLILGGVVYTICMLVLKPQIIASGMVFFNKMKKK